MLDEELEKVFRLGLDALWSCNNPFTKEDLIIELNKVNLDIKDFDIFMEIFKDVIFKEGDKYRLDITKVFNEVYKKK